jgi:hypothetical protein
MNNATGRQTRGYQATHLRKTESLLAFDFFQEKPESGKGAVFRQPKIVSRGFCLQSTPLDASSAGTQLARDIAVGVRRTVSLAGGKSCLPPAFQMHPNVTLRTPPTCLKNPTGWTNPRKSRMDLFYVHSSRCQNARLARYCEVPGEFSTDHFTADTAG